MIDAHTHISLGDDFSISVLSRSGEVFPRNVPLRASYSVPFFLVLRRKGACVRRRQRKREREREMISDRIRMGGEDEEEAQKSVEDNRQ